tara:strand:- start:5562 stop:6458 length:897 start_codon:yes stop_codon:yes gene_type:complete
MHIFWLILVFVPNLLAQNLYIMEVSLQVTSTENTSTLCSELDLLTDNSTMNVGQYYLTRALNTGINCDFQIPMIIPPSPPPSQCDNYVTCQIPLHDLNHRKLISNQQISNQQISNRHYDPYQLPCSAWIGKKCSSVNVFLNAHNCSGIENCIGCCIPESPPPPPAYLLIPSPPPTEDGILPPLWLYLGSILPVIFGCIICTGILISCKCGISFEFDFLDKFLNLFSSSNLDQPERRNRKSLFDFKFPGLFSRTNIPRFDIVLNNPTIETQSEIVEAPPILPQSMRKLPRSRAHMRNRV